MELNLKTIDSIAEYAKNINVKSILQTEPCKVNFAELKKLGKDTFERTSLSLNEISKLKEKVFEPFLKKFQKKLKFEKTSGLEFKERLGGYFNSEMHCVDIDKSILSDPTYGRIVFKKTGETLFTPTVKNVKFPLIGKKVTLDSVITSVNGESVLTPKPFTARQRINLIKSMLIHEPVHGKHIENIMKLEGVGTDKFIELVVKAAKECGEYTEEGLIKFEQNIRKSWEHLKDKQNTIPLDSPLGKKTQKIWNHMLKQFEYCNKDKEKMDNLYFYAPTEIIAYKTQERLSKKLGIYFD